MVARGGDFLRLAEKLKQWTGEPNLHELTSHHYGIDIIDAYPYKGVLFLRTDGGEFALKHFQRTKSTIAALQELQESKSSNSYPLALPIQTKSGKWSFSGFHRTYSLIPWKIGRKPRRTRRGDWIFATKALARFHRDSAQLEKPKTLLDLFSQYRWKEKVAYEAERLQNFVYASAWTEKPNELDQTWSSQAGYITHLIETALQLYQEINGEELEKSLQDKGLLCHGSFHRDNLLFTENGVQILDLHHTFWNTSLQELAVWIEYVYGQTGNIHLIEELIHVYQKKVGLKPEHLNLFYCYSLFPNFYTSFYSSAFDDNKSVKEQVQHLVEAWRREQIRARYLQQLSTILPLQEYKIAEINWL